MHDHRNLDSAKRRVGTTLDGRFTIDKLLGLGGAASVFRARPVDGGPPVAIKLLHEGLADSSHQRARFEREADISSKLDHPNTLSIHEYAVSARGEVFLVMELLEGASLNRFLKNSGGALTVERCVDFSRQLLSGLAAVHSIDVVHRDLKPDNVFVTRDFEVKLLDFGVARLSSSDAQLTRQGAVLGTPSFMAPEQARGRLDLIDAKTDIFAVGATMYRMLTGVPVRRATSPQAALILAATTPPESVTELAPDLPAPLAAIVDRALSYNPKERYTSALEMLEALLALSPARAHEQPEEGTRRAAGAANITTPPPPLEDLDGRVDDAELVDALREVFAEVERTIVAARRQRAGHAQARAEGRGRAHDLLARALWASRGPVELRVRPYALEVGGAPVWEPDAPLDAVPYDLFSSGVRSLTLRPGLDFDQFCELLDVLALDTLTDLPEGADLAGALWERDLEHVASRFAPPIILGDPAAQDAFARERDAEFEHTRRAVARATEARLERTRALLTLGRSALERARGGDGSDDHRLISLPSLERLVEARHAQNENAPLKLSYALSHALAEAQRGGDLEALTGALEELVARQIDALDVASFLAFFFTLTARLEGRSARVALTRRTLDAASVARFLNRLTDAARDPSRRDAILSERATRHLKRLVASLGHEHAGAVAAAFEANAEIKPFVRIFFGYLRAHAARDPSHIGKLLTRMPLPYCERIIDTLAELKTPEAWSAAALTKYHPDPRVRKRLAARRALRGDPNTARPGPPAPDPEPAARPPRRAQADAARRAHQQDVTYALARLSELFLRASVRPIEDPSVTRSVDVTLRALDRALSGEHGALSILFVGQDVFVSGWPLEAPREAYEAARAVGQALDDHGANELRVSRGVTARELSRMLRATTKGGGPAHQLFMSTHVELRDVSIEDLAGAASDDPDDHPHQVARVFAAAVAFVRRLHDAASRGQDIAARPLEHIAQDIVALAEQDPDTLRMALAPLATRDDHATLCVRAAITSTLAASALTRDARALNRICVGALLTRVGEHRLKREHRDDLFGTDTSRQVTDEERARLPSSGAASVAISTQLRAAHADLVTLVYESNTLTHADLLGQPYSGRIPPEVEALTISLACRLHDELAHAPGVTPTPDEAIARVSATTGSLAEQLVLKLVLSALDLHPRGTAVALTSGWRGVVLGTPYDASAYGRPTVRLVVSPDGVAVDPIDVDLDLLHPDVVRLGEIDRVLHEDHVQALTQARHAALSGAAPTPTYPPPGLPARAPDAQEQEMISRVSQVMGELEPRDEGGDFEAYGLDEVASLTDTHRASDVAFAARADAQALSRRRHATSLSYHDLHGLHGGPTDANDADDSDDEITHVDA